MARISPNSSSLDFQALDGAWNTISLVLQGETLVVKYCNSSGVSDERFNAASFNDRKELEKFIRRFRPTSVRLQDKDCNKVVKNMTVCASYEFGDGDVRFYDAVVQEVRLMDHKFGNEVVCTCKFVLVWIFGPKAWQTTDTGIAQICIIPPVNAHMDQVLSSFIEICREKHKVASSDSACVSKGGNSTKEVKMSVSAVQNSKGRSTDHFERTGQGVNLGGKSDIIHLMFIENLEKDLCPLTIMDFVKKHVAVTSQAQVFPSLSSESFARGMIVVESQEDLLKLSDFLHNPNHMILSARGRPWVVRDNKLDFLDNPAQIILSSRGKPWIITEKKLQCGAVGATTGNIATLSDSHPWDKNLEIGDKLRIVSNGSEEYESGKKVKDLFLEFADHQESLHRRLAWEESKILQQANVPLKRLCEDKNLCKLPKSEN